MKVDLKHSELQIPSREREKRDFSSRGNETNINGRATQPILSDAPGGSKLKIGRSFSHDELRLVRSWNGAHVNQSGLEYSLCARTQYADNSSTYVPHSEHWFISFVHSEWAWKMASTCRLQLIFRVAKSLLDRQSLYDYYYQRCSRKIVGTISIAVSFLKTSQWHRFSRQVIWVVDVTVAVYKN